MAVVKNLLVRAGADFSAMRKEMQKAQTNLQQFKTGMNRTLRGIGTALATLGIGTVIKDAVKSAMDVEAAVGQINRTMGSSAQAFTDWANSGAKAFGMGRADAIKFGAVYSNLVSGFAADTATTMKYTQDLLKASAVVASSTGRSIDDVMERIRSGMLGNTEAIEDLGINVNVAMIESTKAFNQFANGKSWEQLGFHTQQTIRYFAILEQSAKKYGTALAVNTNTRQLQFIAQLKDLQLSLGQAFLPIYNAVLPALTSMAQALANTMNVVAQFMQALFGAETQAQTKATEQQAAAVGNLGDAYKAAGKAARGSIAGFDKINALSKSSAVGGAGGGGLNPSVPVPNAGAFGTVTNEVSQKIQEMANKIKEAFKSMADDANVKKLIEAYGDLKTSLKEFGEAISEFMQNPHVQTIGKWIADTLSGSFFNARISDMKIAAGVLEGWAGFFQILDGIISLDFNKVKEGFANWASGIGKTTEGFIQIFSPSLAEKFAAFRTRVGEVWTEIKNINWAEIKDKIVKTWDDLKTETGAKWEDFKNFLSAKWLAVKNFIDWNLIKNAVINRWEEMKTTTGLKWDAFKTFVKQKWEAISKIDLSSVGAAIKKAWGQIKTDTGTIWNQIANTIKNSINTVIDGINRFINKVNGIKIKVPSVKAFGKEIIPGLSIGIPKIPQIPRLARGALAYGPTLAMVGDNPGASTDPEVISPLSKLEGMMNNGEVVSVLRSILQAVRENKTAVVARDDVGRAARDFINDEARRGRNPLPAL